MGTRKKYLSNKINDTKKKRLKKTICGPNSDKSYTCYSDSSLSRLKTFWNLRHPDNKILSNDSREIWEQLRNNLANTCNKESCWLRQKFIKENLNRELLSYTFAPKAPKTWHTNSREWLSSLDIIRVMKQYENKYKCFDFIGPSPIDYDYVTLYGECIWEELCNFDLKKHINDNKYKIGIVFNTALHNENGEHWVALFIDIKKLKIYYFDSVGDSIPHEIMKFVNNVKKQGINIDKKFKFKQNKLEHQKKNTECGMYSLYFIIETLKNGEPLIFNKLKSDDEMHSFRRKYFNFN
jgi:hypothetical protein